MVPFIDIGKMSSDLVNDSALQGPMSFVGQMTFKVRHTLCNFIKADPFLGEAKEAPDKKDELEEYLAEPVETDPDINLLKYWKKKEEKWPKLAKMAKQYLASPASSAGVERVFSAAGRMHDDMRKSMTNESLQHSLFAAFNTI